MYSAQCFVCNYLSIKAIALKLEEIIALNKIRLMHPSDVCNNKKGRASFQEQKRCEYQIIKQQQTFSHNNNNSRFILGLDPESKFDPTYILDAFSDAIPSFEFAI